MRAMNTPSQETHDHIFPAALRSLWSQARGWIAFVLRGCDRTVMRTTGIQREEGARIAIWLQGVESAVRRLILTAALVLTPPAQRARLRATRLSPASRAQRSFRIFSLREPSTSPSRGRAHNAPTRTPHGHIPFPADPILALGAPRVRAPRIGHNGGPPMPRTRAPNPLDRHGRLSRQDPDWRPPEHAASHRIASDALPRAPRRPRPPRDPEALPPSLYDWRRHYDEWERLIPAPGLAARLDALERVAANPGAIIVRTARRLIHAKERALALARVAKPALRKPHRVRHVEPEMWIPLFAQACHSALATHDTS